MINDDNSLFPLPSEREGYKTVTRNPKVPRATGLPVLRPPIPPAEQTAFMAEMAIIRRQLETQRDDRKGCLAADKRNDGCASYHAIAAAAKAGECSKACETCPNLKFDRNPLNWADLLESIGVAPVITGIARSGTAAPTGIPTGTAAPVQEKKLPLIVELGTRLWGTPAINGNEYRFGADQSKAIDPRKGVWFDFTTNQGGHIRDLMKKAEAAAKQTSDRGRCCTCSRRRRCDEAAGLDLERSFAAWFAGTDVRPARS
jgi:hypothetical protein